MACERKCGLGGEFPHTCVHMGPFQVVDSHEVVENILGCCDDGGAGRDSMVWSVNFPCLRCKEEQP